MSAKEELHQLVDMLPETEWHAASRFLQFLADEGADDPMTEEDWAAVREGDAAVARGEVISFEDLKAELGL